MWTAEYALVIQQQNTGKQIFGKLNKCQTSGIGVGNLRRNRHQFIARAYLTYTKTLTRRETKKSITNRNSYSKRRRRRLPQSSPHAHTSPEPSGCLSSSVRLLNRRLGSQTPDTCSKSALITTNMHDHEYPMVKAPSLSKVTSQQHTPCIPLSPHDCRNACKHPLPDVKRRRKPIIPSGRKGRPAIPYPPCASQHPYDYSFHRLHTAEAAIPTLRENLADTALGSHLTDRRSCSRTPQQLEAHGGNPATECECTDARPTSY